MMGPRYSELRRRVAVAVVGIPLVLASLYMGGWWFGVVLAAVAMIATAELFGLVAARGGRPYGVTGIAASGAIVLLATAEPTPADAGGYILAVLVAPPGEVCVVLLISHFFVRLDFVRLGFGRRE